MRQEISAAADVQDFDARMHGTHGLSEANSHAEEKAAALDATYARLGLDPFASLEEKPIIWAQNCTDVGVSGISSKWNLSLAELVLLEQLLSAVLNARMEGASTMTQIKLSPRDQIEALRAWKARALSLPPALRELRTANMQTLGKNAVCALTTTRDRDHWKLADAQWQAVASEVIDFIFVHEAWLNHSALRSNRQERYFQCIEAFESTRQKGVFVF